MGRSKQTARKSRNRPRRDRSDNSGDQQQENSGDASNRSLNYPEIVKENEKFVKYYQSQGFVPEDEWPQFMSTLRQTLPVTFRVTGYKDESQELLKIIKSQYLSNLISASNDETTVEPPKCLEWYPYGLAWQINLSRKEIRNNDTLRKLHNFLVAETQTGSISRQEAVSMLPPLLMDIKSHHKVLDMCAAPGSKTVQLIESLHQNETKTIPDGFVVANDADNKRCYLMVHQVKRLQSPNCVVVNHDATIMPKMKTGDSSQEFISYDRILCDVPCSGDGTLRKNPDVWMRWSPIQGCNMHSLQMKILKRGLELLTEGGRLVYSTCSFNPLEDEAVVAAMLTKCEGTVELVDVDGQLPGLKYSAGCKKWKCMSKDEELFEKFEDVPQKLHSTFRPSMFPPAEDDAEKMHLERCIRILPHHQNTGGFFVAVMEKKSCLPWCSPSVKLSDSTGESQSSSVKDGATDAATLDGATDTAALDGATDVAAPDGGSDKNKDVTDSKPVSETSKRNHPPMQEFSNKRPRLAWGYKEDPFLFLDKDDPIWSSIKNFYSVDDSFPHEQIMYRCITGAKRTLYFVSSSLKNLVENNRDRVKFINLGLKALVRKSSPIVEKCDFRLTLEALPVIQTYFNGRKIRMNKEDMVTFLSSDSPFITRFSNSVQDQVKTIAAGSAMFYFTPSDSDPSPGCEIMLCGWRGVTSLRSLVAAPVRQHYLLLCGVEINMGEEKGENRISKRQSKKERKRERQRKARKKLADDNAPDGEEELESSEKDDMQEGVSEEVEENKVDDDEEVERIDEDAVEERVGTKKEESNKKEEVTSTGDTSEDSFTKEERTDK